MAWARRCDLGCETWPDEDIYSKCIECGEPAKRFSNAAPSEIVPPDEALSRLLHQQFEEYYRRWDAQRDPSRLAPDRREPAGLLEAAGSS